jgi:sulfur carrier protein ThiS adenylyltransferase
MDRKKIGPYDKDRVADRLRDSYVGIAGAGGLGSNAAMSLARSGVGRLLLVDFDRIEESNLNRQYFFLDQVGMYKVDALRENILKAVRDCRVDIHNRKLERGSMAAPFAEVDVVVEALDSASAKVAFIEEILTKYPDKHLVAASGVAGIGGSERIVQRDLGNLILVEDPQALSSDEDVLLSPKVGQFAHHQANIVLKLLLEDEK